MFTPIKADISGNITKIKAVYDTDLAKFRTLQNILKAEKEMYGAEWPKVEATLALLWLKRSLRFIQVFLQSICDGERDENHPNLIRVNATKAYEMALKKYHGWIVQKIFQVSRQPVLAPGPGGSPWWGPFPPLPLLSCGPSEPAFVPRLRKGSAVCVGAGALRGPSTHLWPWRGPC